MDLVHPKIIGYLERLPAHGDPILREMEAQAAREEFPIVGPQVGQLLMLLARLVGPRQIFEMGSGFGYSGLWFAKALLPGGLITLTDLSETRSHQARAYFRRTGQERRVECLVGDAVELVEKATGPFDLIFLDADKARYPAAFQAAWPKLRVGGLFLADNVLWFGKVLDKRPDADTRGILEFTKLLGSTPGAVSSLVPLRDGVSITLKSGEVP